MAKPKKHSLAEGFKRLRQALSNDVLIALQELAKDRRLFKRAKEDPQGFLKRKKVVMPPGMQVHFSRKRADLKHHVAKTEGKAPAAISINSPLAGVHKPSVVCVTVLFKHIDPFGHVTFSWATLCHLEE